MDTSRQRLPFFILLIAAVAVAVGAYWYAGRAPREEQAAVAPPVNAPAPPPTAAADANAAAPSAPEPPAKPAPIAEPGVGYVTRHHAAELVGVEISVQAYMLKAEDGYIIVSDEKVDAVSSFDLPVAGPGVADVVPRKKYLFTGTLVYKQLAASNKNEYSLRLSAPPELLPAGK